jgi:hypothetical protein
MQNIHIRRNVRDQVQGVIEPEDRSWQVVLDAKGIPHLYVRCVIKSDDGATMHGMFAIDDVLPEGMTIEDIMTGGAFEGELTPDEEAKAHAEYVQACKDGKRPPCPVLD